MNSIESSAKTRGPCVFRSETCLLDRPVIYTTIAAGRNNETLGIIGSKKNCPAIPRWHPQSRLDGARLDDPLSSFRDRSQARFSCPDVLYLGTPSIRFNYPRSGNLTVKRLNCGPATVRLSTGWKPRTAPLCRLVSVKLDLRRVYQKWRRRILKTYYGSWVFLHRYSTAQVYKRTLPRRRSMFVIHFQFVSIIRSL
jgi:hypothetical protein